jgi:hypothetical protein
MTPIFAHKVIIDKPYNPDTDVKALFKSLGWVPPTEKA